MSFKKKEAVVENKKDTTDEFDKMAEEISKPLKSEKSKLN